VVKNSNNNKRISVMISLFMAQICKVGRYFLLLFIDKEDHPHKGETDCKSL